MGMFGKNVSTVVSTAALPVAVAKDLVMLGNVGPSHGTLTGQQLDKIKREAQ